MILMSYECNECVLGVSTITGKCFRLEINENGVTGWILSKSGDGYENNDSVTVWAAHELP